jgi:peroxiredoxin/predicted 2-oxoglutarate/Fe(II)-dependent dioxygenase YbiX
MAEKSQRAFSNVSRGDPAPWFTQRATSNDQYHFSMAAGRYIVLCFLGSSGSPAAQSALPALAANRALFDDEKLSFFGVTMDPRDEAEKRLVPSLPGIRYFWDFDGAIGRLYGSIPRDSKPGETPLPLRRFWMVLDPTMRVRMVMPFAADNNHAPLFDYLRGLPSLDLFTGIELQAPILYLPEVFEPGFCRHLIDLYKKHGSAESGFMTEREGKTTLAYDAGHKRRRDHIIEDKETIRQTQTRLLRRVVPEIHKAHQFRITHMERYIVSCYSADDGGHFHQHRDNTTKGTAHRRFAVSINLNEEFEGGRISFPEYGRRSFKPAVGGAVVFSCSLLHAVSKVTAGERYAFLPFLYDEEAAKLRAENTKFLDEKLQPQPQAVAEAQGESGPQPAPAQT